MLDPIALVPPAALGAYLAWKDMLRPWLERRREERPSQVSEPAVVIAVATSELAELKRRVAAVEALLQHCASEDAVATYMATTSETLRQVTAAVSHVEGVVQGMRDARR